MTGPGPRRRARRHGRAPVVLPALAVLASAGCADTVNPKAGNLRLGVQSQPLRPPIRADTLHPFEYPRQAWSRGASGTTVLRILISAEGTVDSALVVESSGDPSLDSAAVANARYLQWEAARQGGKPIPIWGRLPVIYPRSKEGPQP